MSTFNIKKILVPVDFSGTGEKVLDQVALMVKMNNAEVVLLNILEGPAGKSSPDFLGVAMADPLQYEKIMEDWAKKNMNGVIGRLKKQGVTKVSVKIETGTAYKKIVKIAKDIKADIIVMGTHGVSGFREFAVGSNTAKVVAEATCPVLSIQKHIKKLGFKNILVPFRDKPHSREKVDYAIQFAKMYGATIHVLGISYDTDATAVKKLQLEADQIERILKKEKIKCTIEVVKGQYIAKFILAHAAKKKVDMVTMMADLDTASLSQLIMGPVAQQIVNHSPIPVLSIHPIFNPKTTSSGGDWSYWS